MTAKAVRRGAPGGFSWNLVVLVVGGLVFAVLPYILPAGEQGVAVRTLIFALLGVAWNLMSGVGGMFSFGHAAYFGIGAYTGAYLLVVHGISPWAGMAVGAVLAAFFGVVTAFLSFRYKLKGAYFALATFAFAEMLRLLVSNLGVLNKTVGFNVQLIHGSSWVKLQFPAGSKLYYWIPLALLALAVAVTIALRGSRTGQYVMAVRDDEEAASSLGVNVMRYKLTAVAISAAITAATGVYYVQYYLYVNPDTAFGASVSIQAIVPAIIGGVGTLWGPVIGALIVGPLSEATSSLLNNPPAVLAFLGGRNGLDVMLYAALLVVIVVFLPRGVYGSIRARLRP
ncbi:MAG: branched-chain amino acid ABC transporter permease [Streptosporangiaceae bacterium]